VELFRGDVISLILVVMALGVTLVEILSPSNPSETPPPHGTGAKRHDESGRRAVPVSRPATPRLRERTGYPRRVAVEAHRSAVPGKHA
jgi:hypothetical protein